MKDLLGDTLWAMSRILNGPVHTCPHCGHEHNYMPEEVIEVDSDGSAFRCTNCWEKFYTETKKGRAV